MNSGGHLSTIDVHSYVNAELIYINKSDTDGENWVTMKHSHHFVEFFYVTSGRGEFLVEDKRFAIKKNDVIVINPNVEHTEISDTHQLLEYIVIGIHGISLVNEENPFSYLKIDDVNNSILFYVHQLFEEYNARQYAYEEIGRHLIRILLYLILRKKSVSLHVEPSQKVNREIALVRNFIDIHFKKDITLDVLASEAHINKYYLSHAFKKTYDISPLKYLSTVRINTAKFLLESTNYSILDISEIVGFKSQSYFSQLFKKEIGLSPMDYRKECSPLL
ncbi:AraC family transcriptional regulator [Paenibacillus sp. PsM32]|uniref:helix-turn-helix transcriptional regulator n=1 Tax=unclassified Paenibacillus TaxID=185978 RepID=UPI002366040E|nr:MULTISPECIES: AraC family transcriptional regulator [unclassified Paenibacillus]MDN4619555.1 AraC family transcriptional regulator [Paenibacillus sp. PsM32]WDF52369.1 AraC family transcriptional regulator [Paenibacillus sp. KACC 21273]